jgi:hypothetical protein
MDDRHSHKRLNPMIEWSRVTNLHVPIHYNWLVEGSDAPNLKGFLKWKSFK